MFRMILAGLLATTALLAAPAHAGESYDNCTGYVDSIPAVITTQGTWCLRKDVFMSLTSGYAVDIRANNVTLDCNDFKVGGLAAGPNSGAFGVFSNYLNTTVRHCNVRGFYRGITLAGSGSLVEDNRLDQNLFNAITANGEGTQVINNRVNDTGGLPFAASVTVIEATGDVIGNTISGAYTDPNNTAPTGIAANGNGVLVSGNVVRGLASNGTGTATAIRALGAGVRVQDNHVFAQAPANVWAIRGGSATATFCRGNTVYGATTGITNCYDAGQRRALRSGQTPHPPACRPTATPCCAAHAARISFTRGPTRTGYLSNLQRDSP